MDQYEHHAPDVAERAPMAGHEHQTAGDHEMHSAGHDRHAGQSVAMFRDKFWLSLALTIPVVPLSYDIQDWARLLDPDVPRIEYLSAILGAIIFFYGGLVFICGSVGELRDRKPR